LKNLLIIPLLMIVAAGTGFGACRASGWAPHVKELGVAATICLIAGMAAVLPAIIARGSGIAAVSQSGLFGTIIHMFLTILLSAVASLTKLIDEQKPYLFWLLVFYWVSLVAVVIALTSIVRQTARQLASESQGEMMPMTGPRAVPKPTAVSRSS
jgi:hypothetical protein